MVAKYLYDAWGNCTISGETTNYAVAHANPIRYRGYYYDEDTGLYYCNARYYSPKWRRFISPDDTAYLDPESVNGLNLYCYCNNDPVNYADPSGHSVILTACLLAFGVGVVTSVVSQGFQYGWEKISVGQVLMDGALAAASVGLAATGIPFIASVGIGAAMGLGQYAAASAFHNEAITVQGAIIATVLGGLGGAISGEGAKSLKALAKIYDGMTGRAATGFKALITAAQRYGFGSKQLGLVNNLYGKAIHAAVNQGIKNTFVSSSRKIIATTVFTPGASALADWTYGLFAGV